MQTLSQRETPKSPKQSAVVIQKENVTKKKQISSSNVKSSFSSGQTDVLAENIIPAVGNTVELLSEPHGVANQKMSKSDAAKVTHSSTTASKSVVIQPPVTQCEAILKRTHPQKVSVHKSLDVARRRSPSKVMTHSLTPQTSQHQDVAKKTPMRDNNQDPMMWTDFDVDNDHRMRGLEKSFSQPENDEPNEPSWTPKKEVTLNTFLEPFKDEPFADDLKLDENDSIEPILSKSPNLVTEKNSLEDFLSTGPNFRQPTKTHISHSHSPSLKSLLASNSKTKIIGKSPTQNSCPSVVINTQTDLTTKVKSSSSSPAQTGSRLSKTSDPSKPTRSEIDASITEATKERLSQSNPVSRRRSKSKVSLLF